MISALKPYGSAKPSGIKWLGEVPAHWDVKRLGQIGTLFKGGGGSKEDEVNHGVPCVRYGDLYTTHSWSISQSRSYVSRENAVKYTSIRYGDVLFAASGETIDDIGRSAVNLIGGKACCGGDIILFRSDRPLNPHFMGYAADCPFAAIQKARMGRGFTVVHIYPHQIKQVKLALPPLPEQAAIASFLDHAIGLLDRYIRAKEKLIALLEEQKQVIVNDAVTGRIDVRTGKPYPAYKPSGVEWLGDVPTHWEVRRLGQIGVLLKGGGGSKEDETHQGVPCVRYGDLYTTHTWSISQSRSCVSHENAANYTRIQYGDVLFAASGETIGDIGKSAVNLMRSKACCGGDIILFRSNSRDRPFDPCFMGYATDCRFAAAQKAKMGRGFTVVHIYPQQIKQVTLALPPLSEQVRIACFLNASIASLNSAINCTVHEIELLREYRTRLIADVVTGKLDVREAALRLPGNADAPAQESGDIEPVVN